MCNRSIKMEDIKMMNDKKLGFDYPNTCELFYIDVVDYSWDSEKEDNKKEMIKADKGLFIGFILIPMSFVLLIISLIGIYILNITIFELIFIIGSWIVIVLIFKGLDNSEIQRKYREGLKIE